jgi:YidC/Oxa1 family membrane protein insertase
VSIADLLKPLTFVEETVLESLHSVGLGWGLAIVALTLLIRSAMLPLAVRQFRSQRELRRHGPELKQIRERFKHDRERLQQETLAYYRQHGINPLSSLAPMIVQVPVFISLYMLLRSDASSGLFDGSGFLFVPSLTSSPHGTVLALVALLYLGSQLATSAIATRTLESKHRGVAMVFPLLFVGVVTRLPAGLAIYSVTTSLWTLGQQLSFWRASNRTPVLEGVGAGSPGPAGPQRPTQPEQPATPDRPHPRSKKKRRSRSRR